jgi:Zn-dependent peptidase ImmA (M78 family)
MSLSIAEAIAEVYRISGVAYPSAKQHVVLLGELLGGYNLTCTELPGLTSETASNFLLRRGAILEPLNHINKEPLAGYINVNSISGHIFVEHTDLVVRRRFSVAHELGHYVLHFLPLIDARVFEQYEQFEIVEALAPFSSEEDAEDLPNGQIYLPEHFDLASLLPPYEQMEREANQFAAELLMPEHTVRGLLDRYATSCQGDDLIWRLASEMLVSRSAVRVRLRNLRLLTAATARWN